MLSNQCRTVPTENRAQIPGNKTYKPYDMDKL